MMGREELGNKIIINKLYIIKNIEVNIDMMKILKF